jgi:8-amino-7-oxononanoate synthase
VVREYLINYARPLIFTTFMGFPLLAAIKTSYTLLTTGALVKSQTRVIERTALLRRELKACGFPPDVLTVIPRVGEDFEHLTPIMGLLTPQPHKLAAFLLKQKFVARPIAFPAVPRGGERVRVCVHSDNTEAEILELVKCIKIWVSSLPARSHL